MTVQDKQTLKADYEKSVAAYIKTFCKQMEMSFGHWIGDEVGGLADFNDYFTIDFTDIKRCVDEDVTRDTFIEWYDYCVEVGSLDINATIPISRLSLKAARRRSVGSVEVPGSVRLTLLYWGW